MTSSILPETQKYVQKQEERSENSDFLAALSIELFFNHFSGDHGTRTTFPSGIIRHIKD